MMSRSVICFKLAAACALASTWSGRVELRDSREKSVERGHDYSGVVLWLEPVSGVPKESPAGRATMLQKDKKFNPHVLAVRKGTAVEFPNLDPIFHNAFSNFSGQIFDVGLYKPGSNRTVTFNRPGVVRVFCNIHPTMSAVIVVVNTPWFATTTRDGTFRIPDVPPGEYQLRVFHERAMSEELAKVERKVTIGAGEEAPGTLIISETGYLPTPHLNKHDRPYPAGSDTYKVMR